MSARGKFVFGSNLQVVLTKDSVIVNCNENIAEADIRYELMKFFQYALNWVSSSKQLILFNPTGGNINFASFFKSMQVL